MIERTKAWKAGLPRLLKRFEAHYGYSAASPIT